MKRVLFGIALLLAAVVAVGALDAQGYINLGVAAKKAGDNVTAAENFAKAAEVAAPGSKLRNVGLRCYLYSLTKLWGDERTPGGIEEGDKAATALEKEYAKDGDAQVARATWWGRRQFELLKAEDPKASIQYGVKAIEARQDFPMFANNLAVAYCDLAKGADAKVMAQKALDILAKYKSEGKLAETKKRAEQILAAK